MNNSRPLILFGYRACDAWPLINDGNALHSNWSMALFFNNSNYAKNIIVGNKSIKPRFLNYQQEMVFIYLDPTIIPLPQ